MITFSSDPYVAENQMRAIIWHLVAFAYIDADFDVSEKDFIRGYIKKLVEQRATDAGNSGPVSPDIIARWTEHFHEVLDEIDHQIQGYFQESTAHGESTEQFVLSRLKLGCFELLERFDDKGQEAIFAAVETLMHADGVVHENEQSFYDELLALIHLHEEVALDELELVSEGEVIIGESHKPAVAMNNHPFLSQQEWDFARDRATFAEQAKKDLERVDEVMKKLEVQRAAGAGKLGPLKNFTELPKGAKFLDGHVWAVGPHPETHYELLVLGDLHGCYSNLKAALLQVDFFAKAQAHADDPNKNPPIYLVFLGDYIDRGRFSLSGTLRTALQLYLRMPEHVFLLRGNHEYYVELGGKVLAPVRPCEAMDSIAAVAENEVFATYMRLFEALPNMLAFGDLFFVHGGIPRADTFAEHYTGLSSLNVDDLRFQMMWSDPSEVDVVPLDLQKASARFPFGRRQFQQFMTRIGSRVMIRGHEKIDEGMRMVYQDEAAKLITLFSAGGADNDDLPAKSNYREVQPMAMTIRHHAGVSTLTPFEIDYKRFNDPQHNAFFRQNVVSS
ncbi:MAG: serine/threonine protein phosphatase [Deltaproteobacteria bacterium]|nr:serine/threonine protein phosphatase [Deltaproteobacteria bacterium]